MTHPLWTWIRMSGMKLWWWLWMNGNRLWNWSQIGGNYNLFLIKILINISNGFTLRPLVLILCQKWRPLKQQNFIKISYYKLWIYLQDCIPSERNANNLPQYFLEFLTTYFEPTLSTFYQQIWSTTRQLWSPTTIVHKLMLSMLQLMRRKIHTIQNLWHHNG